MKIIDLSVTTKNDSFEPAAPEITYQMHEETVKWGAEIFGLEPRDFPEEMWCAGERVTLGTHSGTHLDAPYHYGPMSGGKPAKTIDEVPLEWCYGDGVILNLTHKEAGELITQQDVEEALQKINYKIKPGDIPLIMTGVDKYFGKPGYENRHPGMSKEATRWLIDQGVKVMGIDAWGWDRPFTVMAEEYKNGVRGNLWAAHYVGKEKEYCHIEKLANLDQIPRPYGFKVAAFPIKIEKASAGWVRPVAIIEDE